MDLQGEGCCLQAPGLQKQKTDRANARTYPQLTQRKKPLASTEPRKQYISPVQCTDAATAQIQCDTRYIGMCLTSSLSSGPTGSGHNVRDKHDPSHRYHDPGPLSSDQSVQAITLRDMNPHEEEQGTVVQSEETPFLGCFRFVAIALQSHRRDPHKARPTLPCSCSSTPLQVPKHHIGTARLVVV